MTKDLLRCMSLPSLFLACSAPLAGWACAIVNGNFDVLAAIFCLLFAALFIVALNLNQCYFDIKHHGNAKGEDGGPGFSMDGMPPEIVLRAASFFVIVLAIMVGVALIMFSENRAIWVLIGGAVMCGCLYLQNRSLDYAYRKIWGLLNAFLFFGPAGVGGTYFIQKFHTSGPPHQAYDYLPVIFLSVAIGMLAVCCLLTFDYRSFEFDKRNGVKSLSVRIGRPGISVLFLLAAAFAFAANEVMYYTSVHLNVFDWESLVPFLVFLVNFYVWTKLRKKTHCDTFMRLIQVLEVNAFVYALYTFILFCAIRMPSVNPYHFFVN